MRGQNISGHLVWMLPSMNQFGPWWERILATFSMKSKSIHFLWPLLKRGTLESNWKAAFNGRYFFNNMFFFHFPFPKYRFKATTNQATRRITWSPDPARQTIFFKTKEALEKPGFRSLPPQHESYKVHHWRTKMLLSLMTVFLINSWTLYNESQRMSLSDYRNIVSLWLMFPDFNDQ